MFGCSNTDPHQVFGCLRFCWTVWTTVKVSSWPKPLHHFLSSLSMWCRQSKEVLLRLVRRRKKNIFTTIGSKVFFENSWNLMAIFIYLYTWKPFVLCFASKRRPFPIKTRDIWVPGIHVYIYIGYISIVVWKWMMIQTNFPNKFSWDNAWNIHPVPCIWKCFFLGSSGSSFGRIFWLHQDLRWGQPWWDFSKENAWHGHLTGCPTNICEGFMGFLVPS